MESSSSSKLDAIILEAIFLKQCEQYDKVRFVLKAMSWPNPTETEVSETDIEKLMAVLEDLRGGKYFDLYIAAKYLLRSGAMNVLDTASNYRCQKSERTLGAVLRTLLD